MQTSWLAIVVLGEACRHLGATLSREKTLWSAQDIGCGRAAAVCEVGGDASEREVRAAVCEVGGDASVSEHEDKAVDSGGRECVNSEDGVIVDNRVDGSVHEDRVVDSEGGECVYSEDGVGVDRVDGSVHEDWVAGGHEDLITLVKMIGSEQWVTCTVFPSLA